MSHTLCTRMLDIFVAIGINGKIIIFNMMYAEHWKIVYSTRLCIQPAQMNLAIAKRLSSKVHTAAVVSHESRQEVGAHSSSTCSLCIKDILTPQHLKRQPIVNNRIL